MVLSHRSTKGASKARRDQINEEIRNMKALLPILQDDQERMSYLHSMAVITAYIRKNILYQGLSSYQSHITSSPPTSVASPPYDIFLPALYGFILVLSSQGRLVYVSENVSDYLGLSMVDVLQGDTFYDMVETQDVETVRSHLDLNNTTSTERSFVCGMNPSKAFRLLHGHCSMLVQGRYQAVLQLPSASPGCVPLLEKLFVGLCTPTVNRLPSSISSIPSSFESLHRQDMRFTGLDDSVFFHLGYSSEELIGRSWYSLLHPEDLPLTASSHKSLMQAGEGCQIEFVFRLQHSDLTWPWIYTRATKHSGNSEVSCTNYVISETEAMFLRQKIDSNTIGPSPPQADCSSPQLSSAVALKRPRASSQSSSAHGREEPRTKTARTSMAVNLSYPSSQDVVRDCPALFYTPPYSPTSSPYSPTSSLYSPTPCYSPMRLEESVFLQGYIETPHGPLTSSTDQEVFNLTNTFSPQSCPPSPQCDFPAFSANARLVPDCLPVADMLESSADCTMTLHTEVLPSYLSVQPTEGATSLYDIHHCVPQGISPSINVLLTPNPAPTFHLSFHYSTREKVEISMLAQQISSLATSFNMSPFQTPSHPEPMLESHPWAHQQAQSPVLDEGLFNGVPWESGWFQPANSSVALCMLQIGCHNDISELHQLNQYLQYSLQEDGLVAESMY
ncbi:hypothetical protein DPEC_G00325340 [Dallia pectoralis]|uniref:Uncharacterized protein n=1 Tax=Dallia pectoralis TaxID=75939 RepID=A0ACC2F7J3_DALPE|nr:hypothetical protein DPEC_G00325340 [Dallia pectoralis]